MIVEPVPTHSPSRRRRALARLAIALPVLLLVAVAGVGLLARTPDAETGELAALETPGVDPSSEASAPADVSVQPPVTLPTVLRPRRPPFPVAIDGLVVQSVPLALAGPALTGRGEVVAIAGYFGIPIVPTDCGDGIDPLGPLCERSTLLAELSWTLVGGAGFGGIGTHVHALAPKGLRLPEEVQRTTMAVQGTPLTAVLIGRFGGFLQDGCTEVSEGCEVGFDLDAVAWAEGGPFAIRPFVDPTIDGMPADWITSNQATVGREVVGPSGILLELALVPPKTLASLDARAARRIRHDDPAGYVWYVRGLRQAPDGGPPDLVWGVVDDTTLRTLATGRVADQAR